MFNEILAATSGYSMTQSDAAFASFLGIYGAIWVIYICLYIIMIAYSIFGAVISTLSLIDISNRTKEEIPDKTTWILLIYPFGGVMLFIPAIIYYYNKRKKFK